MINPRNPNQGQGSALDPPKAEGLWKPFILDIGVQRFGFGRDGGPASFDFEAFSRCLR